MGVKDCTKWLCFILRQRQMGKTGMRGSEDEAAKLAAQAEGIPVKK